MKWDWYRGVDESLARPNSHAIVFSVQGTGGSPTGPNPENGWVIKTLEAQVGHFLLGCKCPVSRFLPGRTKDLSAPLYISYYICFGIMYFIVRFNCVSKITVWDATPGSVALYEPGCWFQVDGAGNRILQNVGTYSVIQLYSTYFRMRVYTLIFFFFYHASFHTNSCHRTYCELEHQMINNYWCVVAAIMTFCSTRNVLKMLIACWVPMWLYT
jgi:hypothetical protein